MDGHYYDEDHEDGSMLKHMATMFDKQKYCDITIKSGARRIKAHRIVLAAKSKWFSTAFSGGFKEKESDTIELHDDREELVMAMIHFFYHGYCGAILIPLKDYDAIEMSVQMYALGEKYICESLTQWAADDLIYRIQTNNRAGLEANAIRQAYTNMVDEKKIIRKILVDDIATRASEVFDETNHCEKAIRDVVEGSPEFAADLLRATGLLVQTGVMGPFHCPGADEGCDGHMKIWPSKLETLITELEYVSLPDQEVSMQGFICREDFEMTVRAWQTHRKNDYGVW